MLGLYGRRCRQQCPSHFGARRQTSERWTGTIYTALGLLEGAVLFQEPGFAIKGGGSEEPTGKDSNESVYGQRGSKVVVPGLATAAEEPAAPEHADDIGPWRTDKKLCVGQLRSFFS